MAGKFLQHRSIGVNFLDLKTHYGNLTFWQVSTARFIVAVMMFGAIEVASFGIINMMLLTMSGIETNPDPSTFPTIGDTLKWLEKLQKEGKLSEEKLKNQAEIFFNGEIKEDKKVSKRKLLGLLQKRNNQLLQSQRKLQKEIGGLGKHGEKSPVDFGLAITDEKKRNLEFIKMCREDVKNGDEYMKWLNEEYSEMMDPKVEISKKIQAEREKILESAKGTETLKIVRERSSGPTIVDTEKAVLSQSKDGSMKKSIMTGTFANVAIKKRKPDDEITGAGKLKRA